MWGDSRFNDEPSAFWECSIEPGKARPHPEETHTPTIQLEPHGDAAQQREGRIAFSMRPLSINDDARSRSVCAARIAD